MRGGLYRRQQQIFMGLKVTRNAILRDTARFDRIPERRANATNLMPYVNVNNVLVAFKLPFVF